VKLKVAFLLFIIGLLICNISYSQNSINKVTRVTENNKESVVVYLDDKGREHRLILNKETGKICSESTGRKVYIKKTKDKKIIKTKEKRKEFELADRLQIDIQGACDYSEYNYTDVKKPYKDVDSWIEIKTAFWLNENKTFSPYCSIVPSYTTDPDFWWSDYAEVSLGLQWYPLQLNKYLKSIRLYATTGKRYYYNVPEDESEPVDDDKVIGIDYYYDNLFNDFPVASIIYLNTSYHTTNYSINNYEACMLEEDIKIGPKIKLGSSLVIPYGVVKSTYVNEHASRWWENYVRAGGGVRWYPKIDEEGTFLKDLMKRFHIYAEVLDNTNWLQDQAPSSVEQTDFRFGLGFSTKGFYRD
jgi:hypothetical protein